LLVDQSEAKSGKKERSRQEAKQLAEDDDEFGKRRLPPRLAAQDGERVS